MRLLRLMAVAVTAAAGGRPPVPSTAMASLAVRGGYSDDGSDEDDDESDAAAAPARPQHPAPKSLALLGLLPGDARGRGRVSRVRKALPERREVAGLAARRVASMARASRELVREGKALLSSEFEMTVVKATRPDDSPAKEKHVHALVTSVDDFDRFMNNPPGFDPFRVTLHKLWSRMAEPDPRTVAKALCVRAPRRAAPRRAASLSPGPHTAPPPQVRPPPRPRQRPGRRGRRLPGPVPVDGARAEQAVQVVVL